MTLDQELRAVLAERAEAWETPPDFEAFIAGGRARQHRHRRVVLSASAVAVAGALAFSLVVGRGLWDTRSAPNPADQPTSPTQEPTAAPTPDDLIGIIGPPPPGTPPTGPATGQLVAAVALYNRVTWVYADGRIINVERHGISDESNGYWVRQLAPLGVEAMRSFLLDGTSGLTTRPRPGWALRVRDGGRLMFAREFDDCRVGTQYEEYCPRFTNPEDWLPPSAWEDPTFRAFVPHSYQVILATDEHSPAEALLPAEAVDILAASPGCGSTREVPCWVLANSVARELADIIDQAGPDYVRVNNPVSLAYRLPSIEGLLTFEPVLPHGGSWCSNCG